ncbi:MAG: hypothetical protein EHM23_08325 [Acidobacteria bacterium]|nr:MAG: hypothetical protein EHM23_08325 [Acidobacteriota bacterium]
MRGKSVLALASLLFGLWIGNKQVWAENSVACVPQFAEGFDGQSIWQTQLFLDGRVFGADQTVINVFSPQGQLLHRVAPGQFLFMPGFFRRAQFPFFGPIPLFGSFFLPDLLFPLRTGFLIVESPGFLNFTAVIRRFGLSGGLISELVISPFDPFRRATLVVEEIRARELAFALANTDPLKRALGRFDFFPLGSQLPLFSFPFDIGPRSQFSNFLFNIFPDLASSGLQGTIRVTSDTPISLMAISADGNTMEQVPIAIEE